MGFRLKIHMGYFLKRLFYYFRLQKVCYQRLRLAHVCMEIETEPLTASKRNAFFQRMSIDTVDAIEHVLNVANSYLGRGCKG
jgi:hypothetical protein